MIKVTSLKEWTKYVERAKWKIEEMRRLQEDPRCTLGTYYRLQYEIEELEETIHE